MSLCYDGRGYIVIGRDADTTRADLVSRLAHELGHHETGSLHAPDADSAVVGQCECRARRWAAREMMPIGELANAFQEGCVEPWALAERFAVTERFVRDSIAEYEQMGLLPFDGNEVGYDGKYHN